MGVSWSPSHASDIMGYPASIYAFDQREIRLLPRFCLFTQHFREKLVGSADTAEIEAWSARLGPTFVHLHHYCYGLMNANRGMHLAQSSSVRNFYLTGAVTEFDYVIERAAPDFVLLPEVITKKADMLLLLNKAPMAVLQFERAIELKQDYWPPYAHLSDHYKSIGNVKKARETLEAGLVHVPDAKGLLRRLSEVSVAREGRGVTR